MIDVLNDWIGRAVRSKAVVVASRDWHPKDHMSFRSHGGPWPEHCVQGTEGAELHPALVVPPEVVLLSKGTDADQEAYSAFDGTELASLLGARAVRRVFVGGLALDEQGVYRFYSVKPGAYPWGNHPNAWRPNHIHFSLFGPSICTRLVTQMYFPGDPLLDLDPIFLGTPEKARDRLISDFDLSLTEEEFALGYRFDIVLRGPWETPMETA